MHLTLEEFEFPAKDEKTLPERISPVYRRSMEFIVDDIEGLEETARFHAEKAGAMLVRMLKLDEPPG